MSGEDEGECSDEEMSLLILPNSNLNMKGISVLASMSDVHDLWASHFAPIQGMSMVSDAGRVGHILVYTKGRETR